MAKKMGNFIYVPREIFEVDKFGREPYSKREAFLDLVQMAAYEDSETFVNGYRYERSRGDVIVSKSFLSKRWGWSVDKVRRYTTYLERNGWCKCRRDDQCNQPITLISIVSYDVYQGGTTTPDTTDDTTPATTSGSTPDTQYKEKEKGIKNKETEPNDSEQVLALYKLYPAKCPLRGASTQKCDKCKKKIAGLLKQMPYEELKKIFVRYIDENYNKHYLLNFQTFLNNLPDYGEADSQLFSSPQVAPAPSSNGAQRFKSREEAIEWATHPTEEEIKLRYNKAFLPIHPMLEGETQEQFRERIRPAWKKFFDEWVGRRLQEVNNNY